MKRRPYAGEVTKDYLKKLGLEYVSTDGTTVIRKGKQLKINTSDKLKKPYGKLTFHDPDRYASIPKEERGSNAGKVCLDIHVLNYVWNRGTKPFGKVVHHRDNNPRNNDIDNLELKTPRENLAEERTNWYVRELKCNLSKPRSFYEDKLAYYMALNEQAKLNHDAEASHSLRSNISQCRARLKYYDSHLEEALELQHAKEQEETERKEYWERAKKKKELKAKVDSARKFYKELRDAYGKDDDIVKKYWYEWKLAIAEYHMFCAEISAEPQNNQLN
jgi:hypothetical protein